MTLKYCSLHFFKLGRLKRNNKNTPTTREILPCSTQTIPIHLRGLWISVSHLMYQKYLPSVDVYALCGWKQGILSVSFSLCLHVFSDPYFLKFLSSSSQRSPSPGPNHTSSTSASNSTPAPQNPSVRPTCSLTPTLAAHFNENLIKHVQGWPADHAEKQVSTLVLWFLLECWMGNLKTFVSQVAFPRN